MRQIVAAWHRCSFPAAYLRCDCASANASHAWERIAAQGWPASCRMKTPLDDSALGDSVLGDFVLGDLDYVKARTFPCTRSRPPLRIRSNKGFLWPCARSPRCHGL